MQNGDLIAAMDVDVPSMIFRPKRLEHSPAIRRK